MKTYHDSFDPIRAIRTERYSYIENYANRPVLDLPWDIAESRSEFAGNHICERYTEMYRRIKGVPPGNTEPRSASACQPPPALGSSA